MKIFQYLANFFKCIYKAKNVYYLLELLFKHKFNKIIWEVNFWAWLESNTNCSMQWYSSDHNDRLLDLPK